MLLFSDWTAVALKKKGYVLPRLPMPFRWLSRRWAESVSQFNLINYCVRGRSNFMEFIYRWLGFIDVLNRIVYVKSQKFTAELREFIYEEIKNKSSLAEDLDEFLGVNAAVKPVQVKGDRSKSAVFDGRRLAKELDELLGHGIDKWELISKVWVEMLSHAAINCKANNHCKQLSKGGQLVILVWLLMTHFGLGNNFQIGEGHARAKLIVGK
ncbi:hypothetical protein BC332_26754 [Capsicum chinense]|nr:hypothetical protein BC332_26754 [Capsicum chinense]